MNTLRNVKYYGRVLHVPSEYNYLTTDRNGDIFAWLYKPQYRRLSGGILAWYRNTNGPRMIAGHNFTFIAYDGKPTGKDTMMLIDKRAKGVSK